SFQNIARLFNLFAIGLFRLPALARPEAVADMKLETYLEFLLRDIGLAQKVVAGSDGVKLADQIQDIFHGHHTGVRAKILALGWIVLACINDPREALFQNADVWKGLIVLKQDVVLWLVLLDEVILQQKSIELRFGQYVFDILYFGDKSPCFGMQSRNFVEIAGNPFFDVLGLAHIDQVALVVEEFIYSG